MTEQEKQDRLIELCPAGKVFEAKMEACTGNLLSASECIRDVCAEMEKANKELRDYAIRDKERIEKLEESNKCKGGKINNIQAQVNDQDKLIAGHLGEHKVITKLEASAGKKWGVGGAFGGLTLIELFKYVFIK